MNRLERDQKMFQWKTRFQKWTAGLVAFSAIFLALLWLVQNFIQTSDPTSLSNKKIAKHAPVQMKAKEKQKENFSPAKAKNKEEAREEVELSAEEKKWLEEDLKSAQLRSKTEEGSSETKKAQKVQTRKWRARLSPQERRIVFEPIRKDDRSASKKSRSGKKAELEIEKFEDEIEANLSDEDQKLNKKIAESIARENAKKRALRSNRFRIQKEKDTAFKSQPDSEIRELRKKVFDRSKEVARMLKYIDRDGAFKTDDLGEYFQDSGLPGQRQTGRVELGTSDDYFADRLEDPDAEDLDELNYLDTVTN